jgi:hypothetical protein
VADDFAKEVRELYTQAEEADSKNCEQALIDLKFEAGDQWDRQIREYRESNQPFPLPCLTIPITQQFTAQLVGDWLANESSVTFLPRGDGTKAVADVRSELMRSIEIQSDAERVYASTLAQSGSCGISNFRVTVEDAIESPFLRDIFIRDIPSPLAVKWDPLSFDPTGKDAGFCFVADVMTVDEYRKLYPKAALPSMITKDAGSSWANENNVFPQEYWKIDERKRTIGMTIGGKIIDLTDLLEKNWPQLMVGDDGQKIVRDDAKCKYAVKVLTNGLEPLADPYELKLPRLPVIRVIGREIWTEDGRVRFGLVRMLRDSQRYKNYLRSIRAELLMRHPRVNFMAPATAIEGRENDWDNTLVYEGNQPPTPVTFEGIASLLQEEEVCGQDMREVTGMHQANLGMPGNETSGRAILARQHEGDTATIIFHKHMTMAQQEAGVVANALMDQVYDTPRTLRTVGPDMRPGLVRVNDTKMLPNGNLNPAGHVTDEHPEGHSNPAYQRENRKYDGVHAAVDLGVGTYDVVASTGPSYMTRRQQTSDMLIQLVQAFPPLAGIIGDIIMQSQDIPQAEEMADRIRRTIDPKVLGDDAGKDLSPEEKAAKKQEADQAQQKQMIGEKMALEGAMADNRLKVAQARKAEADAEKSEADALKSKFEAMQLAQGGDAEAETRLQLEGYNAITNRIKAVGAVTPDAPPSLEEHLAPIVAQLVGEALKQHFGVAPANTENDTGVAA